MDVFVTLSTDELVVLLSTAGFKEEARTLLNDLTDSADEPALDLLFAATVRQLIMKGLWETDDADPEALPIREGMQSFLRLYTSAEHIIRLSNPSSEEKSVLHYLGENHWLIQQIDQGFIHSFSYADEKTAIRYALSRLEDPSLFSTEEAQFYLTDDTFDQLADPPKRDEVTVSELSEREKTYFNEYLHDIKQGHVRNIAFFTVEQDKTVTLEDIAFVMRGEKASWLTVYQQQDGQPVLVKRVTEKTIKEKTTQLFERVRSKPSPAQ